MSGDTQVPPYAMPLHLCVLPCVLNSVNVANNITLLYIPITHYGGSIWIIQCVLYWKRISFTHAKEKDWTWKYHSVFSLHPDKHQSTELEI